MQTEIKNKAMQPEKVENKAAAKELFHFSGSGEYKPIAIEAENREEAEKIWKKKREKI